MVGTSSQSSTRRRSFAVRLITSATLVLALLGVLALPAHAQAVETTVERTVFVGDNVAPLAPIPGGAEMSVVVVSGELPAGITVTTAGSFIGAVTAEGETQALFEITDVASAAQELRTVNFISLQKPVVEVSIDIAAEVRVPLLALIVDAENSLAEQVGGELPPGISLVGGQLLQGTPTKGGVFVSNFAAFDATFGDRQNITVTIKVGDAAIREEIAAKREQIAAVRADIDGMKMKRGEISAAIGELNAQLADLRLKRSAATTREERQEINVRIGEVRAERDALRADRSEVNALISESREQIQALRAEIAELRNQLG